MAANSDPTAPQPTTQILVPGTGEAQAVLVDGGSLRLADVEGPDLDVVYVPLARASH